MIYPKRLPRPPLPPTAPAFYKYNTRDDISAHEMALNLSIFDTEDKINHGIPIVIIVHKGDNRYANLLLAPDTKQIFAQLILDDDDALYAEMNVDGTPYMSEAYQNYVHWQRGKNVVTGWKFMTPEEMKALNWDHYKYSDRPLWQPTIHSHQMFQ